MAEFRHSQVESRHNRAKFKITPSPQEPGPGPGGPRNPLATSGRLPNAVSATGTAVEPMCGGRRRPQDFGGSVNNTP